MTQLGFVLDQSRCIGCHACTVACKVEHGTELGVFRTWVKYVERGEFPDVQRDFAVLRCNHCTDAPCVEICPVKALYKREDGIVDFDPERCIGCKACLNGCPYDALHIDPNSHTASKCNFCAHRVDAGLKPACEIVCPAQAIISGDLHDPDSEVSRIAATLPTDVRAPEQGTGPNVIYVGADEAALDPLVVKNDGGYLTTEIDPWQELKLLPTAHSAPAMVTADVAHPAPWGWRVSSYFLSKGIAAGAMMLALLLLLIGEDSALADVIPGALALAGIAVTGVFLVWDLKQPRRFYYLFTRPQWRSWLTRGAQCINLAALTAFVFTIAALLGWIGVRDAASWVMPPAGALLAAYTAFLFNQCEGRDLWQSPLLLPHTLVNALIAGASALGCAALFLDESAGTATLIAAVLLGSLALSGVIIGLDVFGRHQTEQAARAARNLHTDLFATRFWVGGIGVGLVLPTAFALAFLGLGGGALLAIGAVLALVGLWFYEDAWVRAGQSVPLS
jgi:Fe-S-cluster-containing dehydrogenase component/formate-dependent nitrite reductase membrane component NrfD